MPKNDKAERFEGTWNGEEVRPKRVWSGHRFTDEECGKLLAGEEIEITAFSVKTGKEFTCRGRLGRMTYNGVRYVGFERVKDVNPGGAVNAEGKLEPDGWCRYTFTEDEKADLLAGKTVKKIKAFIGQSGRAFSAEVKWNAEAGRVELVEFLK